MQGTWEWEEGTAEQATPLPAAQDPGALGQALLSLIKGSAAVCVQCGRKEPGLAKLKCHN